MIQLLVESSMNIHVGMASVTADDGLPLSSKANTLSDMPVGRFVLRLEFFYIRVSCVFATSQLFRCDLQGNQGVHVAAV